MADRRVKKTGKDKDGVITSLCNADESWWSPRSKSDAISDIENGFHTYYVYEDGSKATVQVVTRDGKKHLQTTTDRTSKNNLDNLPNC